MADNVLQSARRSISRRVLMLACLLFLIVGLSLVAERAGFIAWDLQPVGSSSAHATPTRAASNTDCANDVIEQSQEAFATDALFVRGPCNTGIVAQRIATAKMLRPTSFVRTDDTFAGDQRVKPVKRPQVSLVSDVASVETVARDVTVTDITPRNTDSNRDVPDEIDSNARTFDACESGDDCAPDDPTDVSLRDEVVEAREDSDDGDHHQDDRDDHDSGDGQDSADSSHGGEGCDGDRGGERRGDWHGSGGGREGDHRSGRGGG